MPVHSLSRGVQTVANLVFSEAEVETLKAKLLQLTDATVIVRSGERDELGRPKYKEVPDNGIRLAAVVKSLEFAVGKPRQTMALESVPERTDAPITGRDLVASVKKNPALAGQILNAIQDAFKNAQAIPVESVKPDSESQPPESESEGSHS